MGATLTWQTVETVQINSVLVEVNKAMGRRGPLYSFRLYRQDKGRNSNYCRAPYDASDAVSAILQANEWADNDKRATT